MFDVHFNRESRLPSRNLKAMTFSARAPFTRDSLARLAAAVSCTPELEPAACESATARIPGTWLFGLNAAPAHLKPCDSTPRRDSLTATL